MPETNISNAVASDLTNAITDYSVDTISTDGVLDQKETTYMNANWSQQLGYYKKIPELRAAIDAKCRWTIGKGYKADEITTLILMAVKGMGKDTFNTIIENQRRIAMIGGDSYAEIITNKEGILINLKPLDPEVMRIVINRKGMIIRYEQVNKTKKAIHKFEPEQIFHLSRNRVADEIHGVSVIDAVEDIIKARNEAMTDWRQVLHWNIKPRWKIQLDTDDTAKIAEFKRKYDAANALGENMYIPKGTVEVEVLGVAPNATLNPLPWIDVLNDYFFQAVGIPAVILGSSKNLTEASVKIAFMAFQRATEEDQLELEEQILSQLNLVVEFEFPAIIQNEMLSEKPEVEKETQAVEPNDTTAEMEGRR